MSWFKLALTTVWVTTIGFFTFFTWMILLRQVVAYALMRGFE
ncbi:hypothetical protein ES703_41442 [subsurface metagenome]